MGGQGAAEVQPVGGLDNLDLSDWRGSDDDVDGDRLDLDVVVGCDAGEDKAAGRDARLVVALAGGCPADESEGEVVAEVGGHQFGQSAFGFGEIGGVERGEVDVLGGARPGHAGEHAHSAFE